MIPDEVKKKFEEAYIKDKRAVWAGVNQTIRKVHEKTAKIVLVAEDTTPQELITPLVQEIKLKGIEHHFGTRSEIGALVHCPRPASAACLVG
jgi:ribosomal protein L7Ae-like RNA K-turn-binding protein